MGMREMLTTLLVLSLWLILQCSANECVDGTFGKKCKTKCGHCLNTTQCHQLNGTCLYGCKAGYRGHRCKTKCGLAMYGVGCIMKCRNCRGKTPCHHITGNCHNGCKRGFQGNRCDKVCDRNKFGLNCKKNCGNCVNNETCNHIDGKCMNGCDVGFQKPKCKKECPDGKYGFNCKEKCNLTCNICNKKSGVCDNGCKPGWTGDFCENVCPDGTFGSNCKGRCKLTCNSCNKKTGVCDNGCKPGWKGDFCENECPDGKFGFNCKERCNLACNSCNKKSGVCDNGCKPGWKGDLCEEACPVGTFGRYCNETCSGNCKDTSTCRPDTGHCIEGCTKGWRGDLCDKVCDIYLYGENCNQKCGNCANSSNCNHVNGSCLSGCDLGFMAPLCTQECSNGRFGYNCKEICSSLCVNGTCDEKSGTCKMMTFQASNQNDNDDKAPFIGVGVGLFATVIALFVLVIVVKRYRRWKPRHNKMKPSNKSQCAFEMKVTGNENGSTIKTENETSPVYDGFGCITSEDSNISYVNINTVFNIPTDKLDTVIAVMSRNENEGFRNEYSALPTGELHTCEIGKKKENVPKNRYKTTFPYDHSRVILEKRNGEESDYINANFIEGANHQKEYIASQGPKPNTLGDFWRMVWQENVTSIVMVTTLVEGEKVKCSKYWPDKDKPTIYGPVQVTLIEEKDYACFTTRQFSALNKELNITRVVTQYQYTSWPDHGVPEPLCLLTFHNHVVHTSANNSQGPTIVHCSAGVGRTGTYIALDVLVQIGKRTGKVNVAEFVAKMRQNRVSMVQTYEQYMTIYLSLNEIFKAPIKANTMVEFLDKAEKSKLNIPQNENPLHNEFKFLLKIRQNYGEDDYIFETNDPGDQLSGEILPLKKYCLYLSPSVTTPGNYINAITVPSFTNLQRFIVTRYPLEEKAVDLFRLLSDQESDTIISLEPLRMVESMKAWLPSESSSITIPPFTVYHRSKSHTDVISHEIQIVHNDAKMNTVMVVEPDVEIQSSGSPVDTSQLRSLVSTVLHLETKQPITIMSSDGASLCGVFIAIHNVIQQMNMDDRVDVFTAVRQLQIRRPEFCARFEDYETIYLAVMDHFQIASENIYCNQ